MFSVISRSSVRPPPAPSGLGADTEVLHPGLGYHEQNVTSLHMQNMMKVLPQHIRPRVTSDFFRGVGMAQDTHNNHISNAELCDSRGARVYCVFYGKIENEEELRDLYDLPETGDVTDCRATSSSALLLLRLYLKGFMDAYGDQTSQPETCLDAVRGEWAFCLFDESNLYLLVARDAGGAAPLFWGTADTGAMLLASDARLLTDECGKGMGAPSEFPVGCYFESEPSYEDGHVNNFVKNGKQMKAVPRVNSQGMLCGVIFATKSSTDLASMNQAPGQTDIAAQ